jgi:hypothetical protein
MSASRHGIAGGTRSKTFQKGLAVATPKSGSQELDLVSLEACRKEMLTTADKMDADRIRLEEDSFQETLGILRNPSK